jgi:hypothetical protein
MGRRPIALLIFLGFLAVVGMGRVLGIENRAFQYGFLGFGLVLSAGFVWRYARTNSSAERLRLIDSRGVNLLPHSLRRWLFDE